MRGLKYHPSNITINYLDEAVLENSNCQAKQLSGSHLSQRPLDWLFSLMSGMVICLKIKVTES